MNAYVDYDINHLPYKLIKTAKVNIMIFFSPKQFAY